MRIKAERQSQVDALKQYGCGNIFQEKITGTTKDRPYWYKMSNLILQLAERSPNNSLGAFTCRGCPPQKIQICCRLRASSFVDTVW